MYNTGTPCRTKQMIMSKYHFYQETKCIVWQRSHFSIEAESYEQALEVASKFKKVDISTSDESELITNTEYNSESYEMLVPSQNEYKATCELYSSSGEMLGNNIQDCIPDDDFLFDKLVSMLKPEYFHVKDDKVITEYALRSFNENCRSLEKQYPALKNVRVDGEKWNGRLKDAVLNTYKLQLHNTTLFQVLIGRLNRYDILESSRQNQERPFGFVIDYIKDVYGVSKVDGWDTAMQLLAYYGINN